MNFGEAIKHGFANLTNFDGRDARSTFWWWVLFLAVIMIGISFIAGIYFAASSMSGALASAGSGIDQAQIEADMYREMSSTLSSQAWFGAITSLITLALFIASFVRRLRDAGLPVLIAIVPVATSLFAAYSGISNASEMAEIMASGNTQAINEAALSSMGSGLVGWLGYIVVIVCGLFPTKGA